MLGSKRGRGSGTGSVRYSRGILHRAEHRLLISTASFPAGCVAKEREADFPSQADLGSNPGFAITLGFPRLGWGFLPLHS